MGSFRPTQWLDCTRNTTNAWSNCNFAPRTPTIAAAKSAGAKLHIVHANSSGGTSLVAVGEGHVDASALILVDIVPRPEPEGVARESKTERATRAKALVVTLGPGAYVEPQTSGALEALTQQPGAELASAPFPVDQQHRNVGLDDAV